MLCSLPRSCLVHPVDHFDSEGWFSSDHVIFLNCVSCFFFGKKHAAFKWKDAISGFPVFAGSAEALVRWGGKIKYILIAYFLGNICAKNCRNRTVYVKIIASCKGGTFFETRCSCGRQPNFAALNRGRHLYSAGRPSRWALAHISSLLYWVVLRVKFSYFTLANSSTGIILDFENDGPMLKPNSITLGGSKLVRSWSQTGSKPNSIALSDSKLVGD